VYSHDPQIVAPVEIANLRALSSKLSLIYRSVFRALTCNMNGDPFRSHSNIDKSRPSGALCGFRYEAAAKREPSHAAFHSRDSCSREC
jgi:hypothetical protein